MRHLILLYLFFCSFSLYGQHRLGIEFGIGTPTFGFHPFESGVSDTAKPTFTAEVNYLEKVGRHVYLGAKVLYERYDFVYSYQDQFAASGMEWYYIKTKCNYLFIAPTLDIGIGRHQYFHFYLSAACGVLLNGNQNSYEYSVFHTYPPNPTTNISSYVYNSDYYLRRFVFHINFGFEEHIKINRQWHILLSQGLTLVPTNMTFIRNPAASVHPGFASLKIGVLRKYGRTAQKTKPSEEARGN